MTREPSGEIQESAHEFPLLSLDGTESFHKVELFIGSFYLLLSMPAYFSYTFLCFKSAEVEAGEHVQSIKRSKWGKYGGNCVLKVCRLFGLPL